MAPALLACFFFTQWLELDFNNYLINLINVIFCQWLWLKSRGRSCDLEVSGSIPGPSSLQFKMVVALKGRCIYIALFIHKRNSMCFTLIKATTAVGYKQTINNKRL